MSDITAEEIELLLQYDKLTPELQQLIQQYQQATSLQTDPMPQVEQQQLYPIGSHCAVIYAFEHYELLLLPAIVLSYSGTKEEAQVLVITPVTVDCIPCIDYFEQNKQCVESSLCPYSHGHTVPTNYILPFEVLETDSKLNHLHYGKKAWCKKDGEALWKLGNIIDQLHGPRWRIRLKKREARRAIINVDLEHIMPFKSLGDDESEVDEKEEWSESDRESVDDNDLMVSEGHKPEDQTWGSWQVHTTGFAAKMMKKMGYIEGNGLGLDGKGQLNPIEAQPYSNQKSSNNNSRPGLGLKSSKKKDKRKSSKRNPASAVVEELDMFGLTNTLLGNTNDKKTTPPPPPLKTNNAATNQTRAKLQSQLDQAQYEYIHATEAFRRNKASPLSRQFSAKLKIATVQLDNLKMQMDQLERQVKQSKEKQDMYTF